MAAAAPSEANQTIDDLHAQGDGRRDGRPHKFGLRWRL